MMPNFNKSSRESEEGRTFLPGSRYQQKVKPKIYPRNYAPDSKYAKKAVNGKTIDTLCIIDHCSALDIDRIKFSKDVCVQALLGQKYIRKIRVGQLDDVYKLTEKGTKYLNKIIKYASQIWGK